MMPNTCRHVATLAAVALVLSPSFSAARAPSAASCGVDDHFSYQFRAPLGDFILSWNLVNATAVELQWSLPGTSYSALALNYAMINTDMIIGWVDAQGKAHVEDYWSTAKERPLPDTAQGGTRDTQVICGSLVDGITTLRIQRLLDTGDKFDTPLVAKGPNHVSYAYGSEREAGNIYYHDHRKNHVQVDFTHPHGITDNSFGAQVTGLSMRWHISNHSHGTLISMQTQDAPGQNFPFGSVAEYVDLVPGTGRPILLLSDFERNVINSWTNERVSLSVNTDLSKFDDRQDRSYMAAPRGTLQGVLKKVPAGREHEAARRRYIAVHPMSRMWIDFKDFYLYYLEPTHVYWVGGFGINNYIGWVASEQYLSH